MRWMIALGCCWGAMATQLVATQSGAAFADDFPFWRGSQARGVVAGKAGGKSVPTNWDFKTNVLWKLPLPEKGNSTPIISGKRVFLTQALEGGKRRALLCIDKDGKLIWQREVGCAVEETSHRQNPPCSASPVTDGKTVYAYFASGGVSAYDFEGKELWHVDLGPVLHRWGNGPSPIIYQDKLILFHGPGTPAVLMALDRATGKTVWRSQETAINSPIFGSWSTPIILKVPNKNGTREEMIFPLPGDRIGGEGLFKAYDPSTGKELWQCRGLGTEIYAMPVVGGKSDVVVGISGHNGPVLAVKPGGDGDVTATHRLWQLAGKNPQRVGSGLIHDGLLYLADAPGFITCVEAATGKDVWKQRLEGTLWGTMLLAEGKIFVSNLEGATFVLRPGRKFELLAKNDLNEPIYAAPAIADGRLYLRTYENLYCIGNK